MAPAVNNSQIHMTTRARAQPFGCCYSEAALLPMMASGSTINPQPLRIGDWSARLVHRAGGDAHFAAGSCVIQFPGLAEKLVDSLAVDSPAEYQRESLEQF
jgi:hypothetical protein